MIMDLESGESEANQLSGFYSYGKFV